MQFDQSLLVQAGSNIPTGQHESDRQMSVTAPAENHSLSIRQHLVCNAAFSSGWAVLERIHTGVVQAQVKTKTLTVQLFRSSLDSRFRDCCKINHPPCGSGAAGPEGRRLSHRVVLEPLNQSAIAATPFNTGLTAPRDAMKPIGTPRDAIRPNGFFVEAIVISVTGS